LSTFFRKRLIALTQHTDKNRWGFVGAATVGGSKSLTGEDDLCE